ncbi:hypothetical protein HELRODRAFT_189989 [Helobdella robusta]|uniref:UBC core domain-containing protein n=1 Tax=Helobdella robusta TaxID=6412 RepID=T1FRK3_HELRO|nr:hypothetical protein HELRODRAFT_189989 [Helobdella robusta]ESO11527.1 hypothetical protein HELRODRAFT_189989 [Helobdella robusta]
MEQSYNLRSPAVKRLMREAKELKDKTEQFSAHPLEDNLFEWHFTIRGPVDTEFENGLYHGRIVLPPDYPMKPPSIILLTPSGRFEVNRKICLSISGYHPETWQPSWSLRTALLGIIGFMPSHGNGAIGSLDYTPDERRILAKKSQDWKCPQCGPICNLVLPVTELSKKLNAEAKELGLQIKMQGEKTKTTESSETPPTTAATTRTTTSVAAPTSTSATGPSPAQNLQMPHQQQFFTAAAAQLNQHSTFPNIPLAPSFAFPYFGGAPPANSTPSQFSLLPHMPSQFPTSFLPPPPLLPPFFCPPFPPPPPLMTHQTPGTSTQQNVYGMPSYPFYMNPMFSSSDYYRQWPFPNTAATTATITAATATAADDASSGTTITATISAATSVISSTAWNYTSSTTTSVAASAARISTTASAGGVVVSSAANLGNSSSVVTTTAAAKMTTAKMTSTEATATTASAPEPVTKTTNVSLTNSSSKAVTTTAAANAATATTTLQSSSKLNEENKSASSSTAFSSTSSSSTAAATTSSPPPSTTSASTASASETSSSSNLRQRKQSLSTSAASTSPTNGSTPAAAARPIRTQQRRSARLLSGLIRMFAAGLLDFFIVIIAFAIFSLIGLRMLWMV